ncbi:biotin--[acetyl-CoA-carboxylase] ligase [Streptomyces alkaliphilus]|uniref:biotin--[acetyl-CoA-carboxylase] ligase n=1 Tax=Streptomyces alkaliphilus TaxID=1472722 RepID=UPI00117FCBD4|nr:biotin--[acetyl-CoA-carboxylase] ligase [Streptomyces alkaliphilus]MQS07955.1 biotin--[acetyl-CoA-carboxylase] ligase [Streptomyces alkaliphilus]
MTPSAAGRWTDLDRPPLNAGALRRALTAPTGPWAALEVLESTGSTNADLAERARAGTAVPGTVLIAEEQTGGRGRLGRSWNAPARSGLFLSVLLSPRVPGERWGWLPLLAGVAAAEALARTGGIDTALKWPNDLLITVEGGERKVGGILAERVPTPSGEPMAVLGIGINVSLRADELPVPGAGSLVLAGAPGTDRNPLLRAVLRNLADRLRRWEEAGGDPVTGGISGAYTAGCATLDREVRAELPGGDEVIGRAIALDGDGRLVIRTGDGVRRAVSAADVVHLRARPTGTGHG